MKNQLLHIFLTIVERLSRLCEDPPPPPQGVGLGISIGTVQKIVHLQEPKMPQLRMRADEQVPVLIKPVDFAGNPAFFENLAFENSNPDVLDIIPATAESPTLIRAKGPVGTARVTITADVKEGEEVKNLQDFADFEIVAGEAVGLGIQLGTPSQIPPPTV